jgi:cell division protein FtsB
MVVNVTLKKVLSILKNKYVIVLLIFVLWVGLFDQNNLLERVSMNKQINNLKKDKAYYEQQVTTNKERLQELQTDNKNLEKFAREQYLMKRDNEDIFIIVE